MPRSSTQRVNGSRIVKRGLEPSALSARGCRVHHATSTLLGQVFLRNRKVARDHRCDCTLAKADQRGRLSVARTRVAICDGSPDESIQWSPAVEYFVRGARRRAEFDRSPNDSHFRRPGWADAHPRDVSKLRCAIGECMRRRPHRSRLLRRSAPRHLARIPDARVFTNEPR